MLIPGSGLELGGIVEVEGDSVDERCQGDSRGNERAIASNRLPGSRYLSVGELPRNTQSEHAPQSK